MGLQLLQTVISEMPLKKSKTDSRVTFSVRIGVTGTVYFDKVGKAWSNENLGGQIKKLKKILSPLRKGTIVNHERGGGFFIAHSLLEGDGKLEGVRRSTQKSVLAPFLCQLLNAHQHKIHHHF